MIAILLFNVFGGDRTPETSRWAGRRSARTTRCSARTSPTSAGYTCKRLQGTEADVIARQRDSVAKRGARFVDDVTDVKIDGDRATATVTYHFDKAPDEKTPVPMTFVREDGAWKVCSTGPG